MTSLRRMGVAAPAVKGKPVASPDDLLKTGTKNGTELTGDQLSKVVGGAPFYSPPPAAPPPPHTPLPAIIAILIG